MSLSGVIATVIACFGDWHWYADLFSHLRPQYCVWLGLAIIGAFVCRHRVAMVLAMAGLLINAVALAPYAFQRRKTPSTRSAGRTWTFITINLLQGNQEVARVIDHVRATQPDIVVFQEVTARWAVALESLSDLYPHRLVRPAKSSFGIALFSRMEPVAQSAHAAGNRVGDLAIFGTWDSESRRFSLAGVHPDKPDEQWKTVNRTSYLGRVADWAAERAAAGDAVIVIGDFNATPWSTSLRWFVRRTGLRNANDGKIFAATWNVWQPHRLLIDQAFFSPQWTLQPSVIGPDIGSDHRPLLVRATLFAE